MITADAARIRHHLALALVCLATVLVYAPSFLVPFQFDDYARLLENAPLRAGELVAALGWLGNSRLLPSLTLVFDYQLYGDAPAGYHLLNLALHLLAVCGVFFLARALSVTPGLRGRLTPAGTLVVATVAAVVFACHPVQTEAVTYIIQRSAVMAGAFYVWAVVCYVRARNRASGVESGRPRGLYVATGGLGLAALLSKENAATLPLVLLAAEWIFFARPPRRVLVAGAGMMLGIGVAIVALKAALWNPMLPSGAARFTYWRRMLLAMTGYAMQSTLVAAPSVAVYALTQAVVVPRYLALLVAPWGLNVDHDVPLQDHVSVAVVVGWGAIAALIGAALVAARRLPLVAFGIWWFLLALVVESSVVPLADVMAERRLYLAMPGVGLLAGSVCAAAWRRRPRLTMAAGLAAVAVLGALSVARVVVWQSPLTLWRDAADKSPGKARPWLNLGVAYQMNGDLDRAVDAYCHALARRPDDELVRENLELALIDLGRLNPLAGKPVAQQDGGVMYELPDVTSFCPPVK